MFKKNSANSLDRQIWCSLTLVLANLYNLNALKQSFCKFFKVAWLGHNAILSQGRGCVLGDRDRVLNRRRHPAIDRRLLWDL